MTETKKKHKAIWTFSWLFIITPNYMVTTGLGFFSFISLVNKTYQHVALYKDNSKIKDASPAPKPLESVERASVNLRFLQNYASYRQTNSIPLYLI